MTSPGGALVLLGSLERGGSETKFVTMAKRLADAGLNIHVGHFDPPETLLSELDGVPTVNLKRRGKWSPSAFGRLRRYVEDNGIRTIVPVNYFPLAHAVPLARLFGKNRIRVIASINTTEPASDRERRFLALYRHLLNRCDRIVMGSAGQQSVWTGRFGIDGTRCSVIYNGVDTVRFDPKLLAGQKQALRDTLGIQPDAIVAVAVGRLRPEKAQIDLIHALEQLERGHSARMHIVLVGDGPERERIEAAARDADIDDRVHLVGAVDDVRPYLALSDLFVLPSLTETFSNAALEAGAMDLPIVMGNVGGAMEMFPPERGGILFEAGDTGALAAALMQGISRCGPDANPATGLRKEVLSRFSIASMDSAWRACLFD